MRRLPGAIGDTPRVRWSRPLAALAVLAVAVVLGIGLLQSDGGGPKPTAVPDRAEIARRLALAPPALRALYADGPALLPAGERHARRVLRRLRGHPVVLNLWGAWCGPCRAEFPLLRRAVAEHGARIAFLGVDVRDQPGRARAFLRRQPTAYPHLQDPAGRLAVALGAGTVSTPSTIFLDPDGRIVQVKQGPYRTYEDLVGDLRRYGGDAG